MGVICEDLGALTIARAREFWIFCATVLRKKIISGRKSTNINTKILRRFITVKAHYSMTHLKQQKSF